MAKDRGRATLVEAIEHSTTRELIHQVMEDDVITDIHCGVVVAWRAYAHEQNVMQTKQAQRRSVKRSLVDRGEPLAREVIAIEIWPICALPPAPKTRIPGDVMVSPDAVERMEFGKLIEQVIAEMYARRYNVRLRKHNKLAVHPRFPWMIGSFDRTVDGQRVGLECKNVDSLSYRFGGWGDEHSDQVPQEYLLQCAHYLAVSGYDAWVLAACVGGNTLKIFRVERDSELVELIEHGEAEFWQHIERNEAPALDYQHPTAIPLLKKLFPGSSGETIRLPAEAEAMHYARLDFTEQAELMSKGADAAKARILHMMGEAAVGLLPNGGGYTRKIIKREGYTVESSTYVDFRFSARKGEKA